MKMRNGGSLILLLVVVAMMTYVNAAPMSRREYRQKIQSQDPEEDYLKYVHHTSVGLILPSFDTKWTLIMSTKVKPKKHPKP